MAKKRRNAINADNYHDWAARESLRFESELKSGADASRLLGLAQDIGNMYAEFGDSAGAKPWYTRALGFLRRVTSDPSPTAAYMLWRVGDQEGLDRECRALISHRTARADVLRAQLAAGAEDRRHEVVRVLALAYLAIATSHLYLRQFRQAREVTERAEAEAPFGHETKIIGALADALEARDEVAYKRALRSCRGRVFEWPTVSSDSAVDLYRLAMAYGKEYFGSIPPDLQEELRDREL